MLDVQPMVDQLAELQETCAAARVEFSAQFESEIERYRALISESVARFVADFKDDLSRTSGGNPFCVDLAEKTSEYLNWLQWTFWDLPYFAVAGKVTPQRLERAVRTCGMAYLSARIVDDVIDRHFSYKGRHGSLLELFVESRLSHQRAEGLTILAGLLVCFSGLSQLATDDAPECRMILRQVIDSLRRTTIGVAMEMSPREDWTESYYERMITLKNVEFWRALYAGVDPHHESGLLPFLERYYALSQKLNDVQDLADDERRGQPNIVSLCLPRKDSDVACSSGRAVPAVVETALAKDFLELGSMAEGLAHTERLVARLKLHDRLLEASRLGLFVRSAEPAAETAVAPSSAPAPLELEWYSTLEEVVRKLGPEALVDVNCAVCKASQRKRLFEKQGFTFHRCLECSHVYVSPRITGSIARRIGVEVDSQDHESSLMIAQKFYAAAICNLLRMRAPGARLLDIGFGQGWIVQLARSYGFEAYGTESSPILVKQLRPQFGDRLHLVTPGNGDLPWNGFDAVVISHVLEHLEDPVGFLDKVYKIMNPDGVLYVAVPDIESLHFQLFGKKWEIISPLAHFQYFSEATLSRGLRECLFTDLERIDHAHVREEFVPRWTRLMRKLGGTDAGELAILCRRPNL
ncbi:MAG: methyltransferase domain-containing protein [Candidatus Sulfotelmatobacter sp.]